MATNITYTKEELENLGIFELRTLGREMGAKSPTTANKADLIQTILDIQSGKIKPEENKTKRGRPPKTIKIVTSADGGTRLIDIDKADEPITAEPVSTLVSVADNVSEPPRGRNNAYYGQGKEELKSDSAEEAEEISMEREGWLEILQDGYGFLRAENCENSKNDAYVPQKLIKMLGLRKGDHVKGQTRMLQDNRQPAVFKVTEVNGLPPFNLKSRPNFDNLIPIYPNERFKLENAGRKNDFAIRCIDLIAPIGKGQRAMIVSPPKAGKTTLLKLIANAITANYPEVEMYVLLVDERPEEVTDMKRSINGTVIYSTFDETPDHHAKSAELLIERAKRSVEMGKDVVVIMDSLTRLARAYNLTIPPTGRTLSGGIDPGALHSPKRFFGAARNIENGGSLTIIATALVDTGSRMDDVIYEEFKGTGNMEIHLDRKLSEKRIFPAVDLNKSGTRREELLLSENEYYGVMGMRRLLADGENQDAAENLIQMLVKTRNNQEFVNNINMEIKFLEKEGYHPAVSKK